MRRLPQSLFVVGTLALAAASVRLTAVSRATFATSRQPLGGLALAPVTDPASIRAVADGNNGSDSGDEGDDSGDDEGAES
jgi:hypothetical protein